MQEYSRMARVFHSPFNRKKLKKPNQIAMICDQRWHIFQIASTAKQRRQSDLEQEMSLAKLDEGNAQKEYEEPSGEYGPPWQWAPYGVFFCRADLCQWPAQKNIKTTVDYNGSEIVTLLPVEFGAPFGKNAWVPLRVSTSSFSTTKLSIDIHGYLLFLQIVVTEVLLCSP